VQDEAVEADVDREAASEARSGAVGRDIERLYRDQGLRLWRALVLTTASPDVADDAVAEAFAQALSRGTLIREPLAWIWRVALRTADREMRERRGQAVGVEAAYEMPEPVVDLIAALAALTAHQRTAVVLADYAGYSHRDIADVLGSSVFAVGVHVHRGRRKLRKLLEAHDA
jgi:RNA polymerase sigma-70 factor (ECF subfamily)